MPLPVLGISGSPKAIGIPIVLFGMEMLVGQQDPHLPSVPDVYDAITDEVED